VYSRSSYFFFNTALILVVQNKYIFFFNFYRHIIFESTFHHAVRLCLDFLWCFIFSKFYKKTGNRLLFEINLLVLQNIVSGGFVITDINVVSNPTYVTTFVEFSNETGVQLVNVNVNVTKVLKYKNMVDCNQANFFSVFQLLFLLLYFTLVAV
jgi:hypothetical protein